MEISWKIWAPLVVVSFALSMAITAMAVAPKAPPPLAFVTCGTPEPCATRQAREAAEMAQAQLQAQSRNRAPTAAEQAKLAAASRAEMSYRNAKREDEARDAAIAEAFEAKRQNIEERQQRHEIRKLEVEAAESVRDDARATYEDARDELKRERRIGR